MNQSNKALRDLVAEILAKSYDIVGEAATIRFNHDETATQILALVTNHIKGNMPRKYTDAQVFNSREFYGYNQALDEVHQLLEEVSNADQ